MATDDSRILRVEQQVKDMHRQILTVLRHGWFAQQQLS